MTTSYKSTSQQYVPLYIIYINDREKTEDYVCSERTSTFKIDNMETVEKMIMDDRRVTVRGF